MNLFPNLQTFLTETQSYFETTTEEEGKLVLTLKPQIIQNPDSFGNCLKVINPLKRKLRLDQYIELKFVVRPTHIPGVDHDLPLCQKVEYHIDTITLHTDRLKSFFQYGITKTDVTESLSFLLKNGWTEKEFQAEIGLSRSTFFRYAPKPEESKTEPLPTEMQNTALPQNN